MTLIIAIAIKVDLYIFVKTYDAMMCLVHCKESVLHTALQGVYNLKIED